MKFPQSYYLSDVPPVKMIYSNNDAYQMSTERLLNGNKDHYIEPKIQNAELNKRKIIVINNWHLEHLVDRDFIHYIDALICDDFVILQADGDALVPITSSCQINTKPSVVFDPKKLSTMLARNKPSISHDQALIFDYFHHNVLEKNLDWLRIETSVFNIQYDLSLFYSDLKCSQIDLREVKFIAEDKILCLSTADSIISNNQLNMLIEETKNIGLSMMADEVDLNNFTNQQTNNNLVQNKLIHLFCADFNISTIQSFPSLDSLFLIREESDKYEPSQWPTHLNQIKNLGLECQHLQNIPLTKQNNLKILSLTRCSSMFNDATIFSSLESLQLALTDHVIVPLLTHIHSIKHLALTVNEDFSITNLAAFQHLTYLSLQRVTKGTLSSFVILFNNAPLLKHVALSNLILSGNSAFPQFTNQLKILTIANSTITAELLKHVLSTSPGLEKLVLTNSTVENELELDDIYLPHLKQLLISDTNIKSLFSLLRSAPALEDITIDIGFYENHTKTAALSELQNLKWLTLALKYNKNGNKTTDIFELIMPKIKSLNLIESASIALDLSGFYPISQGPINEILQKLNNAPCLLNIKLIKCLDYIWNGHNGSKGYFFNALLKKMPNIKNMPLENKMSGITFNPITIPADKFIPNNTTWSQNLLIQRLNAYLDLMHPNDPIIQMHIERFGKGICAAVCKFYAETCQPLSLEQGYLLWSDILTEFKTWNGKALPEPNSSLDLNLKQLYEYADNYYIQHLRIEQYEQILSSVDELLKTLPNDIVYLSNAWHQTCLFFKDDNWVFFDPNHQDGQGLLFKPNQKEQLKATIYQALGHGLSVCSHNPLNITFDIRSRDNDELIQFFKGGGFKLIINKPYAEAMIARFIALPQFKPNQDTQDNIESIFYIDTANTPFWLIGIKIHPIITLTWLQHYYDWDSQACQKKLTKGLETLTPNEQVIFLEPLKNIHIANNNVGQFLLNCVQLDSILPSMEPNNISDNVTTTAKDSHLPLDNPLLIVTDDTLEELEELDEPIPLKEFEISKTIDSPEPPELHVFPSTTTTIDTQAFLLNMALTQYQQLKSPIPVSRAGNPFLETTRPTPATTLTEFNYHLLKESGKKLLLHYRDRQTLINHLHHLMQHRSRPIFIVNSLEDLHCFGTSLVIKEGNICHPDAHQWSGPLYWFLEKNKDHHPILVVNWDNFTPQEIVQANTLLDTDPSVDMYPLPNNTTIIGLQNSYAKNAYMGEDFTSRHDELISVPESMPIPALSWPTSPDVTSAETVITIDFYDDPNWQQYFYGNYRLESNNITFQPSPFITALAEKPGAALTVILKNPPHDEAFEFAINRCIASSTVDYRNKSYSLPAHFQLEKTRGYAFKFDNIEFDQGISENHEFTLNPTSLSACFTQYVYQNNSIITQAGVIEAHKNKRLTLYVTRALSTSEWAKLINEASVHQCTLHVTLAPTVYLPKELNATIHKLNNSHITYNPPAILIISNDLRMTEKKLLKNAPRLKIIDVTELKKNDVFYQIDSQFNSLGLTAQLKLKPVWEQVLAGETIVFKGTFSPELADTLAPLFQSDGGLYYNGEVVKPKGKLIILTNEKKLFHYAPVQEEKKYTFEDRIHHFSEAFKLYAQSKKDSLQHYSFDKLYTLSIQASYPCDPAAPWLPLRSLPDDLTTTQNGDLSEKAAQQFLDNRIAQIEQALTRMPILFLSGKTGVGKSSFMHTIAQQENMNIIFGDITAWANTPSDGKRQILFIDEANLNDSDWSGFESMFNNPPTVLDQQGNIISLSDQHVVVFAGNPANYGGARKTPALFENHPNVETFGAMTNAYLFHQILKPLVDDDKDIALIFLDVFHKVKALDEEAFSPRELQMMGFLFKSKITKGDRLLLAKHQAFDVAMNALRLKDQTNFTHWFETAFGRLPSIEKTFPKELTCNNNHTFYLTPSHHPLYTKLDDLMHIRTLKTTTTDPRIQSGGLSGLVVEGRPGIGKSHFIKQYLLNKGFNEKRTVTKYINNPDTVTANHFYYLPASAKIVDKEATLIQAFHEGAVVILDEMNASDILIALERLVNALLMGEDLNGKPAKKPGFTLLGTQNPLSMAGRKEASLAMKRRLIHCECPDYTLTDMFHILTHSKKNGETKHPWLAYNLITDFMAANQANGHKPKTFRDLLRAEINAPIYDGIQNELPLSNIIVTLAESLKPLDASDQFLIHTVTNLDQHNLFDENTSNSPSFNNNAMLILTAYTPVPQINHNNKISLRIALYQLLQHYQCEIPQTIHMMLEDVTFYLDFEKKRIDVIKLARLTTHSNEHARIAAETVIATQKRMDTLKLQLDKISNDIQQATIETSKNPLNQPTKTIWTRMYDFFVGLIRNLFYPNTAQAQRQHETSNIDQSKNLIDKRDFIQKKYLIATSAHNTAIQTQHNLVQIAQEQELETQKAREEMNAILMLIQKRSTPNQTSTLDNTLRTDDHDEVVRHGRKI